MKIINEHLISTIESAIKQGLKNFESLDGNDSLSDIYLYFDEENTSLIIYDDMENRLKETEVDNFRDVSNLTKEQELIVSAKQAIVNLEKNGIFNKEYIYKPFSISFVDNDFIVSEELFFMDDDTLKLDDKLLVDLDKDLDAFLKKIME